MGSLLPRPPVKGHLGHGGLGKKAQLSAISRINFVLIFHVDWSSSDCAIRCQINNNLFGSWNKWTMNTNNNGTALVMFNGTTDWKMCCCIEDYSSFFVPFICTSFWLCAKFYYPVLHVFIFVIFANVEISTIIPVLWVCDQTSDWHTSEIIKVYKLNCGP